MGHPRHQVVVVGAGPVGSLLGRLLLRYGIDVAIIEKRSTLRHHPQAHYINARTLEILRSFCWDDHVRSLRATPASISWRDFVYCHTVQGPHYLREDQFQRADPSYWLASPASNIHLAQSVFESILLRDAFPSGAQAPVAPGHIRLGHELRSLTFDEQGVTVEVSDPGGGRSVLSGDYLVACDGAHSRVRTLLGIEMEGEHKLQHLMNIHFCCPGLRARLPERTAMLYFVFNQAMVCVFVSHDIGKDEWICQIPYFPPFESPQDFTADRVRQLLQHTLFGSDPNAAAHSQRIQIRAINHWVMHAEVAKRYVEPRHGRVFLAGDAAHRFPPAGGFGMNTGIQDVHNLAWRLAHAIHGHASTRWVGRTYEKERRGLARENTAFALRNYTKSVAAAQALGLDPKLAEAARDAASSPIAAAVMPSFLRTQAFLSALRVGLQSLTLLQHWRGNLYGRMRVAALRKLSQEHGTLPLVFPEQDLGFAYEQAGLRTPHWWLLLTPSPETHSLQDDMVIASSVDLPPLLQGLRRHSGGSDPRFALPPVTVLLRDEEALEQVVALMPRSVAGDVTFVQVHRPMSHHHRIAQQLLRMRTENEDVPPTEVTCHASLQRRLQIPCFDPNLPETAAVAASELECHHLHELRNLDTENSDRLGLLLSDTTQRIPVSTRFKALQRDQVVQAVELSELSAELPRVMAIRPDGHIITKVPAATKPSPLSDHLTGFWIEVETSLGATLGDEDRV